LDDGDGGRRLFGAQGRLDAFVEAERAGGEDQSEPSN
jgi:hypothetical protein